MALYLILNLNSWTFHVNQPKYSYFYFFILVFWQTLYLLVSCHGIAGFFLWGCLCKFSPETKNASIFIGLLSLRFLYHSSFFPASGRYIWLHPTQIRMIPEKERSRSLQFLLHKASSRNDERSRGFHRLSAVTGTGAGCPGSGQWVNSDPCLICFSCESSNCISRM